MDQIKYLNITDCPICGKQGKRLKHTLRFYLEPLKSIVEQRYRYCPSCEWGYCENPLNQECLSRYYAAHKRYLRDTQTEADRMHVAKQVEFAARYMPSGNGLKVLEIGPFQPHFLDAVTVVTKSQGYFEEMNLMAAVRLEASGYIPATKVDVGQQYDLIAMCHVFEHVIDPVNFLHNLGNRLTPNGVIFTEVPDFTRVDWLAQDDLQFEHVN